MADDALELFYCYAREDETLRNQLEKQLTLLQRNGYITQWHQRMVNAGGLWQAESEAHLKAARIIVLLVSPDFMASDRNFNEELREAMRRHQTGEAAVIPVLLRPTYLKDAPFSMLQALPDDGRPVTLWPNRDAAFQHIAEGISKVVDTLNGKTPAAAPLAKGRASKKQKGSASEGSMMDMPVVPARAAAHAASPGSLDSAYVKKAVDRYHKELDSYKGRADHELAVRSAFQNLLADTAKQVSWLLIPEQTIEDGIRPDGVLRDVNNLRRGYWEAKGPNANLQKEIELKIKKGYPLTNTVFEDTHKAVLYQGKSNVYEYDLEKPAGVKDLLTQFLTYTEPHIEKFQTAVIEFKSRIPELAKDLLEIIDKEHKLNLKFKSAFNAFADICRASLNPGLSDKTIDEMLVQHLLTERLFRTVFQNPEFVSRNVIAAEIEKVIQALTSRSFNRQEFFKSLDRYYIAIEGTAKGIESWTERQEFLNTVYEGFFQGFSTKQADTYGVNYTPQEIVDFMCASVEEVLKSEFNTSIGRPGVKILDPATGTGNFIVNLIRHHIPGRYLQEKYKNDLFCNEIMLLPYYIASLNIEHEYYAKTQNYEPFEGICFADTLELAEGQQLSLFVEENTERIQREKDAQIMVVIGNPPYNVGQKNENDNNKNRKYEIIDNRIRGTYSKDSKATLKNQLYDAYVRFFRWATDRLQGRDGVICFITNNSFVDQIAFDGMRNHFLQDFTRIYHLDLHGNVRKNPKLSGTSHNVFGIQVGVGITIAVHSSNHALRTLHYYRVPEYWRKEEKLAFLVQKKSIEGLDWLELKPDNKSSWITEGLYSEFLTFLPIGIKETKMSINNDASIFKLYGGGVKSNRDTWVYNFNSDDLQKNVTNFIETYNNDVSRWHRRGSNKASVDDFVTYDDEHIKWSGDLKDHLKRERYTSYNKQNIRSSLYRPFVKEFHYFDPLLNNRLYLQPRFFPTIYSETENIVICVTGIGADHQTFFASNIIVDVKCGVSGNSTIQCFPYYTYSEDGTNRRENITDWSLKQFQDKYGAEVSKWDIFHYVYGLLHHPQYRARYAENLKRDLPHIPLLHTAEAFQVCVRVGRALMELHLHYEQAEEHPSMEWQYTKDVPLSLRVEKMRLSTDKRVVVVNESLRLGPIPEECFEYRLGNRSALEWVIDQYQVSHDARSGIESDPNRADDEGYIVRLLGQVTTVSVETVRLVRELAEAVRTEDWL